jgi:hypothetical protein
VGWDLAQHNSAAQRQRTRTRSQQAVARPNCRRRGRGVNFMLFVGRGWRAMKRDKLFWRAKRQDFGVVKYLKAEQQTELDLRDKNSTQKKR